MRGLERRLGLVLSIGVLMMAMTADSSDLPVCPIESVAEAFLGFPYTSLTLDWAVQSEDWIGVIEGDDISLQKLLDSVHKSSENYISVLFYASWCPFSKICRPYFVFLSSLFPGIPHLAVEESSIRPSMVSKYGIHGFPTLFLINSTIVVRYRGPRTLNSLVLFYKDVTGHKPATLGPRSLMKIENLSTLARLQDAERENCPFSWARSPEKLLRQETYLALATAFVALRLLYFTFPFLLTCVERTWQRHRPCAFFLQSIQAFTKLKPCRRSNLQEGVINAKTWASKSLVTVSIDEANSPHAISENGRR